MGRSCRTPPRASPCTCRVTAGRPSPPAPPSGWRARPIPLRPGDDPRHRPRAAHAARPGGSAGAPRSGHRGRGGVRRGPPGDDRRHRDHGTRDAGRWLRGPGRRRERCVAGRGRHGHRDLPRGPAPRLDRGPHRGPRPARLERHRPAATGSTCAARPTSWPRQPSPTPGPSASGPVPSASGDAVSPDRGPDADSASTRSSKASSPRAARCGAWTSGASRCRTRPGRSSCGCRPGSACRPWDDAVRVSGHPRPLPRFARTWRRRRADRPRVKSRGRAARLIAHAPLTSGARWELVVAVGTVTAMRRSATSWRGELRLADGSRLPDRRRGRRRRARLTRRGRQPGGRHRHRPAAGHGLGGRAALRDAPRPLGPGRPPAAVERRRPSGRGRPASTAVPRRTNRSTPIWRTCRR